jgi:hypothetical protein
MLDARAQVHQARLQISSAAALPLFPFNHRHMRHVSHMDMGNNNWSRGGRAVGAPAPPLPSYFLLPAPTPTRHSASLWPLVSSLQ